MKNIEINIKEQDTYEALLPASISNVVYSSDTVNSMFNLSEGSKIDDAFSAISTNFDPLMANLGIVTVKLWDGTPVEGISLDGGIKDNNGNTPITDANGRAVVSTNTDEFTFSVASLWADISDVPSQSYPKTGAPTYINVTMADKGIRRLEVTSSQNVRFSKAIKTFDVFGVGGGGGGCSMLSTSRGFGFAIGTGGAGGYTSTLLNVENNNTDISVVIGAGGGNSWSNSSRYSAPSNGGMTTVSTTSGNILTANGGEAGVRTDSSNYTDSTFTDGASGGSGGSSIWFHEINNASLVVDSIKTGGYNGSDGGGTGQGTTTTEFEDNTGTSYSSGGASLLWIYPNNSAYVADAGQGGGTITLNGDSLATNQALITSPTIYGSGGAGNAYARYGEEDRVTSSAGMQGIVIFRWTV